MTGSIFIETLRRHWKWVIYFGVGMGFLGWFVAIMVQGANVLDLIGQLADVLPREFLVLAGISDPAQLASPTGFINAKIFQTAPIILGAFAVMAGLSVTINDEEAGILDVVMSNPLPRWRLLIEKFVAFALLAVAIAILIVAGLWLGFQSTSLDIENTILLQLSLNQIPVILFLLTMTMFLGTVLKRRAFVIGIMVAFIAASYFLDVFADLMTGAVADIMRGVSVFHYYDSDMVALQGLVPGNIAVLLAGTVIFLVGSVYFFNRRDLIS